MDDDCEYGTGGQLRAPQKFKVADVSKLKIKKFNPQKQLKHDRIVFLVGKRGSGKSTMELDLLYHMRDKLDMGVGIAGTQGSFEMFEQCMPIEAVKGEFAEGFLEKIISHQKKTAPLGKDKMRKVFILMDDMMFDKQIFKGKVMRDLFMNGRHHNIFFVNSIQYCMDMEVALRSQVDYCFAMWEPNGKNRKKLWENFFGVFEDYKQFETVFKQLTTDHCALVVDNTSSSSKIEDTIYWYKANPGEHPPFKVGSDTYWSLHHQYHASQKDAADQENDRRNDPNSDASQPTVYASEILFKKKKIDAHDIVKANEHGDEFDEERERERKRLKQIQKEKKRQRDEEREKERDRVHDKEKEREREREKEKEKGREKEKEKEKEREKEKTLARPSFSHRTLPQLPPPSLLNPLPPRYPNQISHSQNIQMLSKIASAKY